MTDRIEEITQKIYNEGVEKAKEDARRIISDARLKAEEIVSEAKKQEADIILKAQLQAGEIQKKTDTELQLAARQFFSTIKQRTTGLITAKQVEDQVEKAFNDKDFIQKIILIIVQNWKKDSDENLQLFLPEKYRNDVDTFFEDKALNAMNKKVEVRFDQQIESGFKIGPKDGGYIISFTDADFINYFKRYLKERTRKLLFESVEDS